MQKSAKLKSLQKLAPWAAGASLAVTHIAMSSHCTVTTQGRCTTCGSCAFSLVALVSWALMKKSRHDTDSTC